MPALSLQSLFPCVQLVLRAVETLICSNAEANVMCFGFRKVLLTLLAVIGMTLTLFTWRDETWLHKPKGLNAYS